MNVIINICLFKKYDMNLSSTKLSVNNLFHFLNSECHVDSWKRKVYYKYINLCQFIFIAIDYVFSVSIHLNIRNASRYSKPLSPIYSVKDLLNDFFGGKVFLIK